MAAVNLDMAEKANRPVKALLTMDKIIQALNDNGQAGVVEIADQIDRPQSVIHDYLSTLTQLGYVTQKNEEYELSLQYLKIGGEVRDRFQLYDVAKPEIQQLAEELNDKSITLCVEENGMCVVLDMVQADESITYGWKAGTYFRMHCSGEGKAILANYSREQVDTILDQHGLPARTKETITDRDDLYAELDEIEDQTISLDLEEFKTGIYCMAVPILDQNNNTLGALSIAGPIHEMRETDEKGRLKDRLLSSSNVIEINYNSNNNPNEMN